MHRQRGELIGSYSKLHGPESIKNPFSTGTRGRWRVPESAARGSKRRLSASIIAKERLKGMIEETGRQMFEF